MAFWFWFVAFFDYPLEADWKEVPPTRRPRHDGSLAHYHPVSVAPPTRALFLVYFPQGSDPPSPSILH